MKKVFFIGAMMLCGMLIFSNNVEAQSKRDINKAKKEEWKREQERKRQADEQQRKIDSIKRAQELEALQAKPAEVFQVEIPCYAESRSDKEFFRELGEGQDLQRNVARLAAVKMAQSMMRERLAHSVKGLSTDYSKLMNKSGKSSDLEQLMQGEFMNVVDGVLKDADNPCERWSQDRTGEYHVYYVIEIQKGGLVDKFSEAINNNDKLRIEFDRDNFRKFADEYMKKQQDFQASQK